MILFPAIDLKNGQCIRLTKGDFKTVEVFSNDPLSMAKKFEKEGATWLHIIDLDGAEKGQGKNLMIIKEIVAKTSLMVEVGGGIRNEDNIKDLLDCGVSRVILGSYAVNEIEKVEGLLQKYPGKIIVSVDSNEGLVTSSGWQELSQYKTIDFCQKLESIGVSTIVYTDIAKDGMMMGPNFKDYEDIQKATNLNIIAAGGVSSYEDIKRLYKMGLYGAIVGKALYLNEVTIKEALQCLQEE